jgi:uncharacterized protein YerC
MIQLPEALLALRSEAEVEALLGVLFTSKEFETISNRWKGCQLAVCGSTQRSISSQLKISGTTAARCARAVRDASSDFTQFVARLGVTARLRAGMKIGDQGSIASENSP